MARTDEQLLAALRRALEPGRGAPEERVAALRAAAQAMPPAVRSATGASRRSPRVVAAAAAAVLLLAGGAALAEVGEGPQGTQEFRAELQAPGVSADVDGRLVEFGRIVHLSSDELPVLPKGEFYEVWFVAPQERPGSPQRISAGTFHPDEQGRTDVDLFAAVDPRLYPAVEVTAEPGGGDPAVEGPVVLRGQVVLR